MNTSDLAGKRVTVMGLGLLGGGVGVTRFLVQQGAEVTVTDLKDAATLADSVGKLDGLPLRFQLGGHVAEDFTEADVVVVNPAVPDTSEFLAKARRAGVPLETEINLFFKLCTATIVGVTGSNGKSTTVSLLHHILEAWPRRAWLGGNIGRSLLERLADIQAGDLVVLELSSFQLERLEITGLSPAVSIVLNVAPNHLDRHGSLEAYARAKQPIVTHQRAADVALLNHDCPVVSAWGPLCPGTALFFSTKRKLDRGAWLEGDQIIWRHHGPACQLFSRDDLKLPGPHFLSDALAAAAAAALCGVEPDAIAERVATFNGLEHRLEFVRELGAVRYYNDSKATTPEAAIAALESFDGPVVLIAGGSDKGLDHDDFGRKICERVRAAVLLGRTAEDVKRAIEAHGSVPTQIVGDLPAAVCEAGAAAQPGDVVLLSSATASYDMFDNFEERGALFKQLVMELEP